MITKQRKTTNTKETKRFSFTLGLSGFLSLAILVVIGMAWSFILGVFVGRGHQPEKVAQEMAAQILPEDFPLLTEKNEEVLKSEELEFFDKLKQGPGTAAERLAVKPPEEKKIPPKPASKNETVATALAEVAKKATPLPANATINDKNAIFIFNYQVAALPTKEMAQAYQKQLEGGGFKSSLVAASHEGKNWYRVYVHHQGTVDSTGALKEKLKGIGITSILLRSRTPL